AAGSIGAKRPERCRLEAMIWVMPRAIAGSEGPAPMKSGSAIGIGWTLPWVMSSLSGAASGCAGNDASAPAPAAPASSARRRRRLSHGNGMQGRMVIMVSQRGDRTSSPADHLARIEGDLDVFPLLVMLGTQHVEWLPAQDCAIGAVAGRHVQTA